MGIPKIRLPWYSVILLYCVLEVRTVCVGTVGAHVYIGYRDRSQTHRLNDGFTPTVHGGISYVRV